MQINMRDLPIAIFGEFIPLFAKLSFLSIYHHIYKAIFLFIARYFEKVLTKI